MAEFSKKFKDKKKLSIDTTEYRPGSAPPVKISQIQGENSVTPLSPTATESYEKFYNANRRLNPRLPKPKKSRNRNRKRGGKKSNRGRVQNFNASEKIPKEQKRFKIKTNPNLKRNQGQQSKQTSTGDGNKSSVTFLIQSDFPRTPSPIFKRKSNGQKRGWGKKNVKSRENKQGNGEKEKQNKILTKMTDGISNEKIKPSPSKGKMMYDDTFEGENYSEDDSNEDIDSSKFARYPSPSPSPSPLPQGVEINPNNLGVNKYESESGKSTPVYNDTGDESFNTNPGVEVASSVLKDFDSQDQPTMMNNPYLINLSTVPQNHPNPFNTNAPINMNFTSQPVNYGPGPGFGGNGFYNHTSMDQMNIGMVHPPIQINTDEAFIRNYDGRLFINQGIKRNFNGRGRGRNRMLHVYRGRGRGRGGKRGRGRRGKVQRRGFGRSDWGYMPFNPNNVDEKNLPRIHPQIIDKIRMNQFRLEDLSGQCVIFSQDQVGSRFLQSQLINATDEQKEAVYKEIEPEALELAQHVFGNYVIQKFFETGTNEQKSGLIRQFHGKILDLTLQTYGCRVIQKALDMVDPSGRKMIVSEIRGNVLKCVDDQNGNHVIQKCIQTMNPMQFDFIVTEFEGKLNQLSCHTYGCRVIQRLLENSAKNQRTKLLDEIISNAHELVKDKFGNYVLQHILEHCKTKDKGFSLVKQLKGKFVELCVDKFASNVIEKCFLTGTHHERITILKEIIGNTKQNQVNDDFLEILNDQYGNFVIQKIIEMADTKQRNLLVEAITPHVDRIKRLTYGKHVITKLQNRNKKTETSTRNKKFRVKVNDRQGFNFNDNNTDEI